MRKMPVPRVIVILVALTVLLAGCAKKTEVIPPAPDTGILNMEKAVKAHPRYAEVEKLQAERKTLLAQLAGQVDQMNASGRTAALDTANLVKATQQEFQTKMAGKRDELNQQLRQQSDLLRQGVNNRLDQYMKELDATYQNRVFALQVKLKTLDLSKEEQATVQKQLDDVQNERMDKIVARQQDLTTEMNGQIRQAEQSAAKELDDYGQQLKGSLDAELIKKQQAMNSQSASNLSLSAQGNALEAGLNAKNQELAKLQQEILADIAAKTDVVASAKRLTTVLADVEIFTALAQDITTDVIAESKK